MIGEREWLAVEAHQDKLIELREKVASLHREVGALFLPCANTELACSECPLYEPEKGWPCHELVVGTLEKVLEALCHQIMLMGKWLEEHDSSGEETDD